MPIERVLIIGGTGLIGSHLAGRLVRDGLAVTVLGRTRRLAVPEAVNQNDAERVEIVSAEPDDFESLNELVSQSDAVFHQAVSVGMAGAVESARDYVSTNMIETANLVDALRASHKRVKKVILGSSVSVYGEGSYHCQQCGAVRPELRSVNHPVSHMVQWDPLCPICSGVIQPVVTVESAERRGESIYAVTKKAQEDLLAGVCRQLNIPLTVLRYSAVLGAGQSWHNPFTRVLEMLASQQAPIVHEDGQQTRDFIFVDDVVEANARVLANQDTLVDFYNVSALHMPLVDFVRLLSASMSGALSTPLLEPIVDGRLVAGDVRHCWVNSSRLQEKLGYRPNSAAHQGVRDLVDWFVRFKGLASNRIV